MTLERELDYFWVVGEISNFRVPPSGHCYFTLKDDTSQLSAVMFRSYAQGLGFQPENGMEALCFGRVSLYPARGDLQLYVEIVEPKGQGALYLAFEQLKKRLWEEGLFNEERKKPLPVLPRSIGIVTSPPCGGTPTMQAVPPGQVASKASRVVGGLPITSKA